MNFLRLVVSFLLFGLSAYGQQTSTITGIKIKSSGFDPQTHTVTTVFINDSPTNITTWGYCVKAQNATSDAPAHGLCTMVDSLGSVIDYKIERAKRPFLPEPICSGCRVIHPGEKFTLSHDFSRYPEVFDAQIEIHLIAYADGSAETLNTDIARSDLRDLAKGRRRAMNQAQKMLNIGQQVLLNSNDQHPVLTMISALEAEIKNDPGVTQILDHFKTPEWRRANDRQFIPENERAYVEQFVADQRVWLEEYKRSQIQGVFQ